MACFTFDQDIEGWEGMQGQSGRDPIWNNDRDHTDNEGGSISLVDGTSVTPGEIVFNRFNLNIPGNTVNTLEFWASNTDGTDPGLQKIILIKCIGNAQEIIGEFVPQLVETDGVWYHYVLDLSITDTICGLNIIFNSPEQDGKLIYLDDVKIFNSIDVERALKYWTDVLDGHC